MAEEIKSLYCGQKRLKKERREMEARGRREKAGKGEKERSGDKIGPSKASPGNLIPPVSPHFLTAIQL